MIKDQIKSIQLWQRSGRVPKPYLPDEMEVTHCLNCGTDFRGGFCPNCGQKANTRRLTVSGVLQDALQLIGDLDSRLLRTSIELLLRPGYMIRDYLVAGKRKPYLQPITLLFLLTSANLIVTKLFGGEFFNSFTEGVKDVLGEDANSHNYYVQLLLSMVQSIANNQAVMALFACFAYLLPNKRTFRKTELGKDMNYLEHFYLLCYVSCFQLLVVTLAVPFEWLAGMKVTNETSYEVSALAYIWVYKQYFDLRWQRSIVLYIKALVRMGLYSVLIAVGVIAIGVIVVICLAAMGIDFNQDDLQRVLGEVKG